MARGPKKPKWFNKPQNRKPKHNWSNDGVGEKKQMLDARREKIFRLSLKDALSKTQNQKNKGVFAANIEKKAARDGIKEAEEYVSKISGEDLEPEIADDIKRLLKKYGIYR